METYYVNSLEEMLNIGKLSRNIGSYVSLNNSKYKLLGHENIKKSSETVDCNIYKIKFESDKIGTLSLWEDNNGFKMICYDYE